jgi:hypothetical protein
LDDDRSVRALAAAEAATGLTDWGRDDSWHTGLDQLLCAAAEGAAGQGVGSVGELVHGLLAIRLHLTADEVSHPEIARQEIERPVVIVGMPRTGTTRLQRLLDLDPAARTPRGWEAALPWPAPDAESFGSDPRIELLQGHIDSLVAAHPEILTMHDWGATMPAECNDITMLHFASTNFWARYGLATYTQWLIGTRPAGKYLTHRRVLQQLQWKGPQGRWTLKSGEHLLGLSQLLDAYPDACLIWIHRDPAEAFPSLASLVSTIRSMHAPDTHRREAEASVRREVGASVRELWGEALERGTRDRLRPEIDAACVDVAYSRLVSNPVDVIGELYERFGLDLTPGYQRRLRQVLDSESRAASRPGHVYRAEDFGLAATELAGCLAPYRERYSTWLES